MICTVSPTSSGNARKDGGGARGWPGARGGREGGGDVMNHPAGQEGRAVDNEACSPGANGGTSANAFWGAGKM